MAHVLDRRRTDLLRLALAMLLFAGTSIVLQAQEAPVMVSGPPGRPMNAEQAKAMVEAQKAAGQGGTPAAQPGAEPKKEGEEKKEGGGEGEKKGESSDTVKRPDKPPKAPDPNEFKISVDEQGRVPPFNFVGQPWPDVMQWLATNSKSSLNWQELPNDYLNLTTQRSYTLEEVRDLINRHLSARGYTAIQSGEDLSVFKIEKLDPSVVRRVQEEELYDLRPYDFVKVSFELPAEMAVDKAKDDVKQVLSPHAKVFPLVTTKRLLVLDSVANLRMVSALLNEERAVQDGRVRPDEIPLRYARAEKVIDILYVVLGMDPQSRPTQMELQLQQQKLQLMTQMQQQGKDVMSMLKKDGPPVYLAYNKQRNSVIANAPPEEMKIIKKTIAYLDVPFGEAASADVGTAPNEPRVTKKYPLTTLDPDNFVLTLEEIGNLSPAAEFRVDKKSKTLFATASAADQAKVSALIDQFDGSGRDFHVIPLRRLPADAVAATVFNLMAGQPEEESNRRRRPYWYYDPWDQDDEDKPVKGFGVDADIENNRLMLWATDAEMERVRGLLVKLGEIPDGQQDLRQIRFVQPGSDMPTSVLLEQIRDAWRASGNNELIINAPAKRPAEADSENAESRGDAQPPEEKAEGPDAVPQDRTTRRRSADGVPAHFVQHDTPEGNALPGVPGEPAADESDIRSVAGAADEPAKDVASVAKPAPVTITITNDGRLMLSSTDPVALDRMEGLIEQLTPSDKRYRVFRLQYITALNMYWNLTDFYKEDLQGDGGNDQFFDWYWGFPSQGNRDSKAGGLSKRRKLMITYDTGSNTILVANASPSQLREIEDLISEYDKPAPADSVRTRRTVLLKIRYSKAAVIAEALKEVYRDLLSSKDKEFDRGDERRGGSSTERTTIIRYGAGSGEGNKRPSPVKVGFEGALSIGVDEISNTLLVSVQEELFDSVVQMVEKLDQEAAPNTVVHVHRVNGSVSAAALRETISDALSKPWVGGRPEQDAGSGRRGGDRRREEGDRDRRRGRDRDRNQNRDGEGGENSNNQEQNND